MTSLIIGRGNDVTVQVEDPTVSSQHLELSISGGQITIRDLNSTNGTKIKATNGRWSPVSEVAVDRRATIMMGDFVATIEEILEAGGIDVTDNKPAANQAANQATNQAAQRQNNARPISMYVRNADGSFRKG